MQLYIPPLGSSLVLSENWTFKLHHEHRNELCFLYFDQKMARTNRWDRSRKDPDPIWVVLPKGTKLKIDRIYIRKGNDDFDSITFTLPDIKVSEGAPKPRRAVRFWVKLDDANNIQFEHA